MQMKLEFKEAAAKQEQQLTDAQLALIEEKKISLAEKKATEKKEHQLQTEKTQLEEEKMVFFKEVETLQQHKQEIERNNAELERENKELKKELQETNQMSKGSPQLEPFSNETEEQNIEQQVHSITQSAHVKPYSTQDTLDFVHTVTQATNKKPTPPSKYRRIKEKTSQGTRKLNVDPMYTYPLLDKKADEEMKMETDGPTDSKKLKKLNSHHMQTINAYAELLVEEYDNLSSFELIESQPKRSYIFSGDLMSMFEFNNPEQNEQMFQELLPEAMNSTSYLIFPILCKSHWTLLILDTTRPMWLFYNSLKIQGRDNYFDASTPLVNFH
ncbi:hypothetical protein RHGRI_021797 [Rhododendron griersonianum]|uniref:Ubiquitin-like protease family profile domain-containing protein n=1 Tax=Rhododendron griersonianum TaxID=479676 RepID=A0AAV6JPT7_9ERIC|nr:hypothetical protein RHGRI_021797 [Rhododendron griersonianum]